MATTTAYKILTPEVERGKRGFPGPGGIAGGTFVHSELSNLTYALAGHTGFAPSANPTFTGTVILPKTIEIQDTSADHQYVLAVSELTADRIITLPLLTGADEFVFKAHIQTLTNKTLTSPKLNEDVALTTTSTKLNYLTSATGTTGTATTNIVFSTSPTFTGTVGAAAITATGVITGNAFRTNAATTDYSLILRTHAGAALYVQNVSASACTIAGFRYNSSSPGGGSNVLTITDTGMTFAGQMLINNGGSIGQTAGPLLTFDDTNNYLEITGCNVGFGFTAPLSAVCINGGLHVGGESAAGDNNLLVDGTGTITGTFAVTSTSTFTGLVKTVGGVHVGGTSDPGVDNLIVDGTSIFGDDLGTSSFASGFAGSGWKLDKDTDYSLTVDNLTVRNKMSVYELEINKISSVNGGIMVSVANGTAYDVGTGADGIFDRWTNVAYDTFETNGLEITSVIEGTNGYARAYFNTTQYQYPILAGVVVNFSGSLTLNSGQAPYVRFFENGVEKKQQQLSAGANSVNHTITGNSNLTIQIWNSAATNFSFASVSITSDENKIYFDDDGGAKAIQFEANDYITAQEFTGRGIDYYIGQVTAVISSDVMGKSNVTVTHIDSTEPWAGAELVQIGSSTEIDRQNLIYITAADTNNPYIDMLAGVDDGNIGAHQVLRIGNLTGINDPSFGGELDGYGLWCDNVYLTGKIILPNAGMTNDEDSSASNEVRIWAGDSYANRESAPFMVTDDGDLTATGIAELGTNVGYDPETTDLNNVAILGCNIYESSRNDDTGSLYINSFGYQGGITKYRNTYIGDGKGGYLLEALGTKGVIAITKAFAFRPLHFTVDTSPASILYGIYVLDAAAAAHRVLTMPLATAVNTQFGAGKSAMYPVVTIINQNLTYNLSITTSGATDTFWYSGSNTKTYVLVPSRSITMTFDGTAWYLLES